MTDPVPSKELHFTWAWDASALNWRLSPIDMGDGLQAGYDHIAGYYERCLIDEIERLRRRVDELNAENDRWADLSNARDDAKLRASAEPCARHCDDCADSRAVLIEGVPMPCPSCCCPDCGIAPGGKHSPVCNAKPCREAQCDRCKKPLAYTVEQNGWISVKPHTCSPQPPRDGQ